MKGAGKFVVSLRGVNFGYWSHLGFSGQTALYLAVKVSFRVARERSLYFVICLCFKIVSLRGQKSLGHAQIGLL